MSRMVTDLLVVTCEYLIRFNIVFLGLCARLSVRGCIFHFPLLNTLDVDLEFLIS